MNEFDFVLRISDQREQFPHPVQFKDRPWDIINIGLIINETIEVLFGLKESHGIERINPM